MIAENTENPDSQDFSTKLKNITDQAELAYNDAKVKRHKSAKASEIMHKVEQQLDELISEANQRKLNTIEQNPNKEDDFI